MLLGCVRIAVLLMVVAVMPSAEDLINCEWKLPDCKDHKNWKHLDFFTNCFKFIHRYTAGLCSAECSHLPNTTFCMTYCKDWVEVCLPRATPTLPTPIANSTVLTAADGLNITKCYNGSTVTVPWNCTVVSEVTTGKPTKTHLNMTTIKGVLITAKETESVDATQTSTIPQEEGFDDHVNIAIPILVTVAVLAIILVIVCSWRNRQTKKFYERMGRQPDVEGTNTDMFRNQTMTMRDIEGRDPCGQPGANAGEAIGGADQNMAEAERLSKRHIEDTNEHGQPDARAGVIILAGVSTSESRAAFLRGNTQAANVMRRLMKAKDCYQSLRLNLLELIRQMKLKDSIYWNRVEQERKRRLNEQVPIAFCRVPYQRSLSNESYRGTEPSVAANKQDDCGEEREDQRLLDCVNTTVQDRPGAINEEHMALLDIEEMITSHEQYPGAQFDR